jgi:hypothetical protein
MMAKAKEPRTESERLFGDYLRSRGLRNFEYEPRLAESQKTPDFCLYFRGNRILFEIKELDSPHHKRDGWFDAHAPIKSKIQEAWTQLQDFPDDCCCIVLYDLGHRAPVLQRDFIYGAMLGKLTSVTPFDPKRGALTEERFTMFSEAGGEMRWESGKPHKTNVSAIVILEQFKAAQIRFRGTYTNTDGKLSRVERAVRMWEAETRARGTKRDSSLAELRAVVYENPYASKRLPRGVFCGPYDEHYGPWRDRIKRTFAGRELRKLEVKCRAAFRSPLAGMFKQCAKKRIALSKNR